MFLRGKDSKVNKEILVFDKRILCKTETWLFSDEVADFSAAMAGTSSVKHQKKGCKFPHHARCSDLSPSAADRSFPPDEKELKESKQGDERAKIEIPLTQQMLM